ncbi:hypothetical protein [Accumulibacter sp.]|uniref:hypothetical protein n=1 Tax=Accumulibacter sp. TaxID=2053492 RepID=UPI0025DA85E1|nr:hypothetical protein [Accumulibacter sp.]MCM8596031.1 hypothetical protein [Accumulibacter sp.]MCM8627068.1 hypothetical protein [Accumulibacter sp.]MDS4050180.1 hypothetical protein [Accumulibacter sp.]
MPVFERLGDVRELAVTKARIGLQRLDAGSIDEARRWVDEAYRDLDGMGLPEADQLAGEMRRRGLPPAESGEKRK